MNSPVPGPAANFRAVFREHAAGVVVITADAGGGPAGFTATSLTSVSLSPPLVSFALSTKASSWPTIAAADSLTVNFLAADQDDIARRFATSGIDRFAPPTRWSRFGTGEPFLLDAPGRIRAVIADRVAVGDHHLVVARTTAVDLRRHGHEPLIYHRGAYRTAAPVARRHQPAITT